MTEDLKPALPGWAESFAPPAPRAPAVGWGEAFSSQFFLENDVANAWELMTQETFKDEDGYDNVTALKERGLWDYRDSFIGVRSHDELSYREAKFKKEMEARRMGLEGGWPAFLGAIAGGVVSPTMFIPLVGAGLKGAAAVRSAIVLGGSAALLQEIPLQLNQTERTMFESGASVLGQAVLSGILGGLASRVRSRELTEWTSDMANAPREIAIPRLGSEVDLRTRVGREPPVPSSYTRVYNREDIDTVTINPRKAEAPAGVKERYVDLPNSHPVVTALRQNDELPLIDDLRPMLRELSASGGPAQAAGAGVSFVSGEGLKRTWATRWTGVGKANEIVNPIADVVEQSDLPDEFKFFQARWMMSQLSSGGMRFAANVRGESPAEGGFIDSLAAQHDGKYVLGNSAHDEAYKRYAHGGESSAKILPNAQAALAARRAGKLSRPEFELEVSREVRTPGYSQIKEVREAADAWSKEVFDPMYEEAVDAGVYKSVEKVIGDKRFLTRVYDPMLVTAHRPRFIQDLSNNLSKKLEADFTKAMEKRVAADAAEKQFLADTALPFDQAEALRKQFLDEIKEKAVSRPADSIAMEVKLDGVVERLNELKKQKKDQRYSPLTIEERQAEKVNPLDAEIESLTKEKKRLEELMPQEVGEFKKITRGLRKRISNLNKSMALAAGKRAGKFDRLERIDATNYATLERLTKKVGEIRETLETLDDDVLDAKLSKLKTDFAELATKFDKGEELLVKQGENEDYTSALNTQLLQETRQDKLSYLAERIQLAEDFDREYVRGLIEEFQQGVIRKTQGIVERRAVRAEKLREAAKQLDPKVVEGRIKETSELYAGRWGKFVEAWEKRGLANLDEAMTGAQPAFKKFTDELATDIVRAIEGTSEKMPVHDLIIGKHGTEKARALDIASSEVEYVLENNIKKLARVYLRTLAPDTEITRRFGDVNASSILGDGGTLMREYEQNMLKVERAVTKKGEPLSEQSKQELRAKLKSRYLEIDKKLKVSLDRLRFMRGIPEDPDGFAYRAGRAVLGLNVLRYMGGTVISSVADPANMVMKHGLTRTFKDVFIPLITNYKDFKLSAREVPLAGDSLDVILHSRTNALFELNSELSARTKPERVIELMTQKFGLISGMDLWNQTLKQISGVGTVAHIMDDIKIVVEGGASAKELAKASEYLASLGLNPPDIEKIWKQVLATNGGNRVNGRWWPNTEHWTDRDAQRMFRAALNGESRSSIVTPGLERPLWMDRNIGWKMLGQFKSFAFSSMSKTLMAGLQQPDMALVHSTLISLALGSLSYYLWALAVGGDALEEAMEFDPAKWADESIARSGRLAIGQEVWEAAQKWNVTAPYATFSGQRTTQRQGSSLLEVFTGPSYDFLEKANAVIQGLDEPTQSTLHSLRQMLPFQNLFYLRQALDQIEKSTGETLGLPERRQ